MSEELDRLNLEWLVINALRESLTLIKNGALQNYDEVIKFAKENFKELFQQEDSHFRKKEATLDSDYQKYVEEANAINRRDGSRVIPHDLMKKRMDHVEALLEEPKNKERDVKRLRAELYKLKSWLNERPSTYYKIEENQALLNDFLNRPELEFLRNYSGKYNVFKTSSGEQFTIRFLHPGKPEKATGVDLLYEIYDPITDLIRIIAVQYKMWEKQVLYFSESHNLATQITTAQECFCKGNFCKGDSFSTITFRFPYCVPFLRLTDKIYDTETLMTSGWHIAMCQINRITEIGRANQPILRLEKIKPVGLNTAEFEKLFSQEQIGSKWYKKEEIEQLYQDKKIINPEEHIVIYSQKIAG